MSAVNPIYWLIPGLLAGRPGPNWVEWSLDELWAMGFRTIVSLIQVDGEAIRAAGFRHYQDHLPGQMAFLPFLRCRLAQRMLAVVDFIAGELAAGRPTLVHCRQGKDRTGAVLAGYLIRYVGLSPEEALARVRQANPRAMSMLGFDRLPALFSATVCPPRQAIHEMR